MKAQQLILNISQPCHEDWARMTMAGQGRFCSQCEKVVVDFTKMTNAELVDYFRQRKGAPICGRFDRIQLETPLQAFSPLSAWARLRSLAAALAGGFALFLSSCRPNHATGEIQAKDSVAVARNIRPDSAVPAPGPQKNTEQPNIVEAPPPVPPIEINTTTSGIIDIEWIDTLAPEQVPAADSMPRLK